MNFAALNVNRAPVRIGYTRASEKMRRMAALKNKPDPVFEIAGDEYARVAD